MAPTSLDSLLASDDPRLAEAIAYVLSKPGKQLRQRLVIAASELIAGAPVVGASTVATAIEWLHVYSLVHDDLPAMDDDDLRRGRPTVHKVYDDATAILVGDGLQAAAFAAIASESALDAGVRVKIIELVAKAVGFNGMVGGQALDMAGEKQQVDIDGLRRIHAQKTGALIRAAVLAGALCAQASQQQLSALETYSEKIGLAFQITDDVLDVTQSSAELGKTAGKDSEANKSTYVGLMGLELAAEEAKTLLNDAISALALFGERGADLTALAQQMVKRSH